MGVKGGEGLFGEGPSLSGAISTTDIILQQQFKNCTNERLKIKNKKIKKNTDFQRCSKTIQEKPGPTLSSQAVRGEKKELA